MGVYEGRGQLTKAMKELTNRWNETRSSWDDAVSKGFEDRFLIPMEQDLRNALSAMDHMAQVLGAVKRDCT